MVNKTKNTAISLIFILLSVCVVFTGLYFGADWQSFIGAFGHIENTSEQDMLEPSSEEEIEKKIIKELPSEMLGFWLNAGEDFYFDESLGSEKNKQSIELALEKMKSEGFNTVFVSTIHENKTSNFHFDAGQVDLLNYVINEAEKKEFYVVLCADVNDVFVSLPELIIDEAFLYSLCENHEIANAIMINGTTKIDFSQSEIVKDELSDALTEAIKNIENILCANNNLKFGLNLSPVWAHKSNQKNGSQTQSFHEAFIDNYADTRKWAIEGIADFLYIDAVNAIYNKNAPFEETIKWWDTVASQTDTVFYCGHRVDMLCSNAKDWDDSAEIIKQLLILSEYRNFNGSVFFSYKSLENDLFGSTASLMAYLGGEVTADLHLEGLAISSPTSPSSSTTKSIMSFTGAGDPRYSIFCNGEKLEATADGLFSVEFPLEVGENDFVFEHKGKKLKYTVTYVLDILTKVSPSEKTLASEGAEIELAALAYKGSEVYAIINDKKVSLRQTNRDEFSEGEGQNDYATYIGSYVLPKAGSKIKSLGNIFFYSKYNGLNDSIKGGEVFLNPEKINNTDFLGSDSINNASSYVYPSLLNPYNNHNLGTALMCLVTEDYAEATNLDEASDKSDPKITPLLKGTIDYVTDVATYNGKMHYCLESGRKIYATDANLLVDGYRLPENNLTFVKTEVGKTTDIYLKTNWLVPINALALPQAYYVGFEERPFNIRSFTASYVDFVFYYTSKTDSKIEIPPNSVISKAEWINSDSNTITLRLFLKEQGKFYGYDLSVANQNEIKLSLKPKFNTLSGKLIMLDPGHGGFSDPGTYSVYPDLHEKTITIALAKIIKQRLEVEGATVIMTRTQDVYMPREQRAAFAKTKNPDLFVSVHCDGSKSSKLSGTHTFYYRSYSKPLADAIHKELVATYREKIYEPGTVPWNAVDRGVKFKPFNVTRIEECPSVLIEFGFLTNAYDCNVLINPYYQDILATAAANGIKQYAALQ